MKEITKRQWWKRPLALVLSFALVASSFSMVGVPERVQAADGGETVTGAVYPGGVGGGLISWVNVERSAEIDGEVVTSLKDLADNEEWTTRDDPANVAYEPNGMNFNGGIQTQRVMYERFASEFNVGDLAREVFSVQASANYSGFPWELGGIGSTARYGNNNSISTYFGRDKDDDSLIIDVGDYDLKDGAMLNIWSAPDDWALLLNGKKLHKTTDNTPDFSTNTSGGRYYIGSGHSSRFNGMIAETLLFNRQLDDNERMRVNSYLALKYGLTLRADNDSLIDYVVSDDSTMWTASNNIGYGHRITGIGRDDNGALYQKQSRAQVDKANVTIALGDTIAESNAENSNNIENDKSFFVFSDNGAAAKFVTPAEDKHDKSVKHTERIYKVEKNNWQDADITFEVDKVENASEWPLYLVVSSDDEFTKDDDFYELVDGKVTRDSSEFENGAYFTIAASVPIPTSAILEQTEDGNTIILTFDQKVELNDAIGFTITVGEDEDEPIDLSGATFEVDETNPKQLIITLSSDTDVTNGKVNVSYEADKGNLRGTNGVPVNDFEEVAEEPFAAALQITKPSGDPAQINEPKPEFEGTAEAGSIVTVEIKDKDGNVIGTPAVTVKPDGTWSFIPDNALPDGEYTVEVTAKKDGKSTTKTKALTVDTSLPSLEITEPSEGTVTVAKPEFKGTIEAGSTVTVEIKDTAGNVIDTPTVTVNPDGTWSFTPDNALPDGDYTVEVTAEKDGQSITETKNITVDTSEPTPSVDKSALQALVADINLKITDGTLKAADYTPESWQELQTKLNEAKAVLNDTRATQTKVDQAFIELAEALNNLKPKQDPVGDAPKVVTTEVYDPAANKLVLTFDKAITLMDANGFSLIGSKGAISVTDSVYDLSDGGMTLTLTLDRDVKPGELLTVSYDQDAGNIVAVDGGQALGSFTRKIVTNQVQPPQSLTGELNALGLTYTNGNQLGTNPGKFDSDTDTYSASVSNGTTQISINPEKAETGTSLKVLLNGQEVAVSDWSKLPLRVGVNTIEVEVYDQAGNLLNTYTIEVTRQRGSSGSSGGGGGNNQDQSEQDESRPDETSEQEGQPVGIITTDNGQDNSFATGEQTDQGTKVNIDSSRLQDILDDGQVHQLAINVDTEGDVEIEGLTAEDIRQLRETGSIIEINTPLARYPVPENQLNLEALARHFGNTALGEIEAQITIRPANAAQVDEIQRTAARGNYELLINPVHIDLTFNHDGGTIQIEHLDGYAAKYIALPAGVNHNRITTGIITYPDGTVFHVPTEVVTRNGQYYAKINDLLSHGTYSVIWNPKSFADVESHWVQTAANNMGARLVIEGTGNNLFEPDREVTRAEFATFIARGLGLMHQNVEQNIFTDVVTGTWYHDPIVIASQFGIVLGYDEGTFRGQERITREQGIAMIARAYRLIEAPQPLSQTEIDSILAKHIDSNDISFWAQEEVALMVSLGIVHGDSNQHLNPQAEMTRAEAAALIQRILQHTGLID